MVVSVWRISWVAGKWWNRIQPNFSYGEPLPVHLSGRGFLLLLVVSLGFDSLCGTDFWKNSVAGSWSLISGNTEQSEYSASAAFEREGDLQIGTVLLKDTELRISLSHARGTFNDSLYQNEGEASIFFDIMAHQKISPFLLTSWEYDSTAGLESRTEMGAGLKWALGHGFSISGAAIYELEDYVNEVGTTHFRWSFRPKYKKTFSSGVTFNSMFFFKPIHGDLSSYLLEHNAAITLPTTLKWLTINLTVEDSYNSKPPGNVKKWDNEVNIGFKIIF